jgi:hypothetical protein
MANNCENIMSFDIGIKNMAYCIFEIDNTNTHNPPFKVLDWNVLNLMEKEEPHLFCNCHSTKIKEKKERIPKKIKKVVSLKKDFQSLENFFVNSNSKNIQETPIVPEPKEIKLCGRAAKYKKGDLYYCEKHSKTQTTHIIPTKNNSLSSLKKESFEELSKICAKYSILGEGEIVKTKKAILEKMDIFFKAKCLETVVEPRSKTAGDTDLIVVGKNMKKLLNEIPEIERIDRVIIENQISPIANRMKTVQGMLAQYFIMKNNDIHIDFISSANKLKCFAKSNMKPEENIKSQESSSSSQKYSQHKKDGVFYTLQLLEKNAWLQSWYSQVSQSKKKDDLADSFLQGLWFLNSREKIEIKDDLQILPKKQIESTKNNI